MPTSRCNPLVRLAVTCLVLAVAGCGGGGGQGKGSLALAVGVVTADYVVLDLASGAIETRTAIGDLATSSTWRTSKMVFKAIPAATAATGSAPTAFGHQGDETQATTPLTKYYLAVFEVTQAQWQTLAGTTPWTAAPQQAAAGGATAIDPQKPAVAFTYEELLAACTAWNGAHQVHLSIPTAAQWEYGCRGGSSGDFSWGSQRDEATAGQYAAVFETQSGVGTARRVGSLTPNALGLYDMHGNVWEWTSVSQTVGDIRGGSWNDVLSQARCANRGPTVDYQTRHALVGARLVLSP